MLNVPFLAVIPVYGVPVIETVAPARGRRLVLSNTTPLTRTTLGEVYTVDPSWA